MKNLITTLLFALSLSAMAQTDTNTPPVPAGTGSFFATAQSYFTSFNTNSEMGWTQKGEVAAGIASLQNGPANLANELRFGYNLGKTHLSAEAVMRDSGIAGTILTTQAGLGLNFSVYDAKLTLYADGGYRLREPDRWFSELGARVSKKMTRYTFAGIGLGVEVPRGSRVFTAFAGFTF